MCGRLWQNSNWWHDVRLGRGSGRGLVVGGLGGRCLQVAVAIRRQLWMRLPSICGSFPRLLRFCIVVDGPDPDALLFLELRAVELPEVAAVVASSTAATSSSAAAAAASLDLPPSPALC